MNYDFVRCGMFVWDVDMKSCYNMLQLSVNPFNIVSSQLGSVELTSEDGQFILRSVVLSLT